MQKKERYGSTLKAQLLASARDRIFNFVMADGALRGFILNATCMVNEMRSNHELGILETLVLGRAYMGAALMAAALKGRDRLKVQIECSGPIKGLTVEANAYGEVRGYLHQVPIPIDHPLESFSLSNFFGAGFLTVIRYLEDGKRPFAGKVVLEYGDLAKDLAHYYLTSEQVPTAFNLGLQFDPQGEAVGAGGFLLQAMPYASESILAEIEALIPAMPSLGSYFAEQGDPQTLVKEHFKRYAPKILLDRRIEFMCHCNAYHTSNFLTLLPRAELEALGRDGPFPVEIRCHYCNTPYHFDQAAIKALAG